MVTGPKIVGDQPESEETAAVQEVGDVGGDAGAVKVPQERPHPPQLGHVHGQPLDLLLEPPAFRRYIILRLQGHFYVTVQRDKMNCTYSAVRKLFSEGSTDVPALLP